MGIGIPVKAQPDYRSFKQVGDQVEKIFADVGRSASGSFSKEFNKAANEARTASNKFANAYDNVADAQSKAKSTEAQLQQTRQKSEDLAKKLSKAEDRLAEARKDGNAKEAAAAEKELERIRDQAARTNTQVIKTAETLSRNKRDEARQTREAAAAYREYAQAQQRLSQTPLKAPSFASNNILSGALSQSSGMVGQFSMLGGGAGKAFVGGAVAAILAGGLVAAGAKAAGMVVDGFKSVMDTGIDFSKTVNNFQGVTQSSAADTQRMAAAARALGSDTTLAGVSASNAASAMTELAKAGFSVNDAIGAARGTMQLATAAQIDGAQAAEIQANAINAFGLNADSAAHVADVLANAAVGSSADIPDLALALQQVGGISKGFGENIEDTTAALGMFANAGIKGSDAGTLLKTTLQSITDQGNPAQNAIKAMNLQLYDFDTHEFVGFRELFRQLDEAKKRMTPEAFQANANVLFGSDAMRAAVLGNVDSFDKMLAVINRTGTASNMAQAQMQGWPGIVEGVSNSAEALKLSFYDMFNTPAGQDIGKKLVDGMSGLVDWVNTHKPEILQFFGDVVNAAALMAEGIAMQTGFTAKAFAVMLEQIGTAASVIGDGMQKLSGPLQHIPDVLLGPQALALKKFGQDGGAAFSNFGDAAKRGADSLNGLSGIATEFATGTMPRFNSELQNTIGNAAASEAKNREYAQSFKEISQAVQLTPDGKAIVIKENSPEVMEKLKQLGFAVQQLPNGTMTVTVEYRDPSGKVVDPNQLGVSQRQQDDRNSRPHSWFPAATTPSVTGTDNTMPSPSGSSGSEPKPFFDESLWKVAPPVGFTGRPVGTVDPAKVFDAQSAEMNARDNYEQARLRVLELEAKGNASQSELVSARNQVQESERSWQKAQRELIEAQKGIVDKAAKQTQGLADGLGDIGAALDNDLGISKGLPGLADNLVRFVASLSAAPLLGSLSAISKAAGDEGSGILGIAASRGAFGPSFLPGVSTTTTGAPAASGVYPGDAALLANVPAGQYTQENRGDLTQGLADCSSAVEDLVNLMDGRPTAGASMYTGNADQWLTQHGFMPGMGGPGDFRVGFNDSHMQATLPGGTPFNWGSSDAAARRGIGGTGADDPAFTSHYFRPAGGDGAYAPTGIAAAGAALPNSGGATPVFVVNMPGGGISGALGAPAGSAASGRGAGPLPGPGQGGLSLDQWNNIVGAEASGNWQANTGNGFYGGPQFSQPTWDSFKLPGFPDRADLATPQQQMQVGDRVLAAQGPGAWPATSANHPDWFVPSTGPSLAPGPMGPAPNTALPPLPPVGSVGPGESAPLGAGTGMSYPSNAAGGGLGVGGMAMDAAMMGAGALNAIAPGAGAAAQIGIQVANRAIKYAGQVAGIGVSGLFETLSVGDNPMGSIGNSWFGKLAGGLAGARPALPNMAGKAPTPENPAGGPQSNADAGGQKAGNTANITINNQGATPDQNGKDVAAHTAAMWAPAGRQ